MNEGLLKKVTGGLDGVVDGLIKSATGKIKEKMTEAFAINQLQTFKSNVERIGQVKTILNPDSIVNLSNIFFDRAVLFDNETYIESFSQFGAKQVLVEGGPGQGKSLYLRMLCIKEIGRSSLIPIFIEFRNLNYTKPLKEELIEAIGDLGVKLDNSMFDFLAKSEKIILILDGFDEVPNSNRAKVSRELETIVRAYPNLKIVISSRPDSGMGPSFYFEKRKICPMTLDIQKDFVAHIYGSDNQSESINEILSNSRFISEVTTTPLLLTLFTITYNARQFKPDSLSEFYCMIFPTMLYRHDRMKIGFERERKAKLTDYQMQRVFDAISFLSLNENNTRFSKFLFQKYLENSAKLENLPDNIEDLLIDDITSITALIIPDGFEGFSFTHKSIQEYFASVFISRLSEDRKKGFYSLVINDFNEFRKWQNTLSFLETIDHKSYIKYFLLPYKKNALCLNDELKVNIKYASLMKLIGSDSRVCVDENGEVKEIYWGDTLSSVLYVVYSDFAKQIILHYLENKKEMIAEFLSYCDEYEYEEFQQTYEFNYSKGDMGYFIIEIDKIFKESNIQKEVSQYLSDKFNVSDFKSEVINMERELHNADIITDKILPF